ncbi:hypothetical protein ACRQU7_18780 [Caproiciproducens sp. R1]
MGLDSLSQASPASSLKEGAKSPASLREGGVALGATEGVSEQSAPDLT